ncbi:MAG: class I SAM-dependent methyltransferase [Solimonas sp.]
MGDINQSIYLKARAPTMTGRVLEVGSKDYGSTYSFRGDYPDTEYIGVDLAAGKGVDVVHDLAEGPGPLAGTTFNLIVCCSVMEHCPKPWKLADTMSGLLAPGGLIYISVPWVWRYHPYPDDFFRFSNRGVMSLFPDLSWSDAMYSTDVPGEIFPIFEDGANGPDQRRRIKLPAFKGLFYKGARKYLPYLMVNMLGTKPA